MPRDRLRTAMAARNGGSFLKKDPGGFGVEVYPFDCPRNASHSTMSARRFRVHRRQSFGR